MYEPLHPYTQFSYLLTLRAVKASFNTPTPRIGPSDRSEHSEQVDRAAARWRWRSGGGAMNRACCLLAALRLAAGGRTVHHSPPGNGCARSAAACSSARVRKFTQISLSALERGHSGLQVSEKINRQKTAEKFWQAILAKEMAEKSLLCTDALISLYIEKYKRK